MRLTSRFSWTARLRRVLQRGEIAFAHGDLARAERVGPSAVHLRLGETLRVLGRCPDSESHHRRSVAIARDLSSTDPLLLVAALNGLGTLFKDTARFTDAGCHYRQALAIGEGVLGPSGPQLADVHHNLAGLDHAQNRFFHGEPHARRAIQLRHIAPGLHSTGAAGDFAVLEVGQSHQRKAAKANRMKRVFR